MQQLRNFLDSDMRLVRFPARRTMQLQALYYLYEKFEAGRAYSEKEVNQILNEWHTYRDPATLRRELIDYRLLERSRDCSVYTVAEPVLTLDELLKQAGL